MNIHSHRLSPLWRYGRWVLAVALAFSAAALGQDFELTYDLNKQPGTAVDAPNIKAYGAVGGDNFGRIIRAGDINGDGIDDLIIGVPAADVGTPTRVDAGAVYVWFGKDTLAGTKDAAGTAGVAPDVTILGATAGDQLTRDGALIVTDIDGDGVADLLLGALLADGPNEARSSAGEAYIIFGRDSEESFPPVLDLRVQGSGGAHVTLYGASSDDQLSIGGALAVGDVNGDGVNDILLGAVLADGPADQRLSAGEAYVVFGKATAAAWPLTRDLAVSGSGGADVTLYGATAGDFLTFGGAIGVGDVNEDGVQDIILGARDADGPGDSRPSCGEAYLVFGRTVFPATLDLAVQGNAGADVTLYGGSAQDQLTSGGTLAVGDVNGDGFADLLLGAPGGDGPAESRPAAGEAYIISGREAFPLTLDLAIQGAAGASATIYGASAQDQLTSGGSLAVGDVNGDGFTDLLVGAPLADGPGEARTSAGEAYIILGGASFAAVLDLNPDTEGDHADVTIYGASVDDNLTIEGALAVGDVDGDGAADLLLGARLADGPLEGRNNAGEAYVVLGRNPFPATIDLAMQGIGGADVTVYGATGGLLTAAQDQLTSGAALWAGDLNGDGFADAIVGAIAADGPAEARSNAGEAYVIFGTGSLAIAPDIAVEQPAGTNIPDGGSRFGSILIGTSTTRTFTIRNTGLEMLTDLALSKDGANQVDYEVGELPATSLAPGASLTFPVTFTPSAVGLRSALLRIASNDPNENPFEIVMTGNGTAPEIEVEQPLGISLAGGAAHSFGEMHTGGQAVLTFVIRNAGSAELADLAVTQQGPQAAEFTVGALTGTAVAAGATATFTVTFAPTGLGERSTTLSIASNDEDENPFVLQLTGIGKLPAPEITIEQPAGADRAHLTTVPFGAVPVGAQKTLSFLIKNTGSAPLTGLQVARSGVHESEYLVGTLAVSALAPGESTTLQITFDPAGAGVRTAQIEIASNDEDENPFRLTLSGIGVDPEIVVEEPSGIDLADGGSRAFGAVLVGEGESKTFTIRNIGTTDLADFSVLKEGTHPGDFIVTGPVMDSVPPGESTTMTIAFTPQARGARSAVVRLANNDGSENPFDIAVTGTGLAPEIAVEGPDGADLADGGAAVSLGGAVIESTGPARTFTVRNLGNAVLGGLALVQPGGAGGEFTVTPLGAASLQPGESTTFAVTFSPLVAGIKTSLVQVTSNDQDEPVFDISLTAAAYPKEPVFQQQPLVRWARMGHPFVWEPVVTGIDPKTYQWYKAGVKIKGAAGAASALTLAAPKAADAAVYQVQVTNSLVTVPEISPNLHLGVVSQAPAAVAVKEGATLTLSCSATVPPGAGLNYQWWRGDESLSESGRVSGTQSGTLKITGLRAGEAGDYRCRVTMSVAAVPFVTDGGTTAVEVVQPPTVGEFPLTDAYVGEEVEWLILTTNTPTTFKVSGLPPGVTVSKTGVVSGKPKAAKVVKGVVVPYQLKISVANSAGKSPVIPMAWMIHPLEPGAIGVFSGLLERRSVLNGGLGGSIRVVTTSSGAFSGAMKLGGQNVPLKGVLTTPPGGGNPHATVTVKRKAPLPPLTISWTIDLETGGLAGSVADGESDPAPLTAWRCPFSKTSKATAYAYPHTAALTPDAVSMEGPALSPEGEGFALLKVSVTGAATWSGKLADGAAITGGVTLGQGGRVALQVMLYGNTGSVQGWSRIDPAGNWDGEGVIDWFKGNQPAKSSTRSYKGGIPQHELVLTGGRYLKPEGIVLGLPATPQANARIDFFGGNLGGDLTQTFTITDKNAVQVPKPGDDNPASVTVKLASATGLISGSFTLFDADPLDETEPIAILKRTAPFSGVLVPRLSRGAGHFLLPRLPSEAGETVAKTPIYSGGVTLGEATD